jgi:hypothetical protein
MLLQAILPTLFSPVDICNLIFVYLLLNLPAMDQLEPPHIARADAWLEYAIKFFLALIASGCIWFFKITVTRLFRKKDRDQSQDHQRTRG